MNQSAKATAAWWLSNGLRLEFQPGGGLGPSMRTEALYRSTAQRSGPTSPDGTITPRRSPLSHTVRLHHAQQCSRQNQRSQQAGF